MKLPDLNVLLYATNKDSKQHGRARDWLEAAFEEPAGVGFAWAALLARLLIEAGAGGNLTTDAHLAALAIEHGATLASFDRDFGRFTGLDFELLKA